jgi:uncharacterized protein YndB with AHSA1/START domain
MPEELTVKNSIMINTNVTRVWEALTSPEWSRKYMYGCDVFSDWKPGSTIEFIDMKTDKDVVLVKGNIVNIEPKRLLQYTVFGPTMGHRDEPSNYTTVTFKLTPEENHTIVSVTQGDFANIEDGETRYKHSVTGWDFALKKLKEELEK